MSTQLVPITFQVDVECAMVALQIAECQRELAQLQRALSPMETAFGLFEQKVASQSAALTAERNQLRRRCKELDRYTSRLQARIVSDPEGHLTSVFTPDELRAIGSLFGIDVPEEWLGAEQGTQTNTGHWEWADAPDPESARVLPANQFDELRSLYRELAKAFHPDLATDTDEHSYRQEIMLRINHAWHTRDLAALQAVKNDASDFLVAGSNGARIWQLEQLRRDLSHIASRCVQAKNRLTSLRHSKTRALWYDAALANAAIARHVRKLENEIEALQSRQAAAIEEFRIALGQYSARG